MHKTVFGLGSAPVPAEGADDAPPDPLVGWGDGPSPFLLPLDAFRISIWTPLELCFLPRQYKLPATQLHATHPLSKNSRYTIGV